MTNILRFTPKPRRTERADAQATAAIVIFPGVRYERLDAEPAKPRRTSARQKQANAKRRQG